MNDWYNDPPESPEPPECCGEMMEVDDKTGACFCSHCSKRIEPEPEPNHEPEVTEPPEDWKDEQPKLCPHGHEPAECNACMIASDFAYDAAREQRYS